MSSGSMIGNVAVCTLVAVAGLGAWPRTARADPPGYRPIVRTRVVYDFAVSELQPDLRQSGQAIRYGGVVRTIAMNPSDANEVTVATAMGGLFRSNDRGSSWRHLDGLASNAAVAVAYDPNDANVLLATTGEDFHAPPAGGVWVSSDRGETWCQPEDARMRPEWGCSGSLTAFEISFDPSRTGRVFVATACGVLIGDDVRAPPAPGGACPGTWRRVVPGAGDTRFFAMLATRAGTVITGGATGVWRSTDAGRTWLAATGVGGASSSSMHELAVSPFNPSHLFVAPDDGTPRQSTNGGQTWTPLDPLPPQPWMYCGGTTFVKAVPMTPPDGGGSGRNWLSLYASNHCYTYRKDAGSAPGSTISFDFTGPWQDQFSCHADTHDLAFGGSTPLLLGTDAGISRRIGPNPICATGTIQWSDAAGARQGLSALEITDVAGQQILDGAGRPLRQDLYIATMHDGLWASTNGGTTWDALRTWEGDAFQMYRRIAEADSKITFNVNTDGNGNWLSGPGFDSPVLWTNPPSSPERGNPFLIPLDTDRIGAGNYIQGGYRAGPMDTGFHVTRDFGSTWRFAVPLVEASFPGPPHVVGTHDPVVYQGIVAPGTPNEFKLAQIAHILSPTPVLVRPQMFLAPACAAGTTSTATVSLASFTQDFSWYPVYAADPSDANHIIGVDAKSLKVVETHDGGNCWQPMEDLTRLVAASGLYRTAFLPNRSPESGYRQSLVTAISFNPDTPSEVLLGTDQNGIFFSADGGASWRSVPGTIPITRTAAFYWLSDDRVLVGSYGRGLWQLGWTMTTRLELAPGLCARIECLPPLALPGLQPASLASARFDEAMLVFRGQISDAALSGDAFRRLDTTVASTRLFFTASGKPGALARVPGATGAAPSAKPVSWPALRKLRAGQIPIGVLLEKGKARYLLIAKHQPEPEALVEASLQPIVGINGTYLDGHASLVVTSARTTFGSPVLMSSGKVTVVGRGFVPSAPVDVSVDGALVSHGVLRSDAKGGFTVALPVANGRGMHVVAAVQPQRKGPSAQATTHYLTMPEEAGEKK